MQTDASATLEFLLHSQEYLDTSLKYIRGDSNIQIPENEPAVDWFGDKSREFETKSDDELESFVQSRGELWQIAELHRLARSGIITNFGLKMEEGRLIVIIEPKNPTILVPFALNGVQAPTRKLH